MERDMNIDDLKADRTGFMCSQPQIVKGELSFKYTWEAEQIAKNFWSSSLLLLLSWLMYVSTCSGLAWLLGNLPTIITNTSACIQLVIINDWWLIWAKIILSKTMFGMLQSKKMAHRLGWMAMLQD